MESAEMEEKSIEKTLDRNPEDLQGTSELRVKLEDDRRASEAMDVTIRSQRRRISDLKREEQLLQAQNEALDKNIKLKQQERSEMSCFLSATQVANMINTERAKFMKRQRALQEQLEEYRLALDSCRQDLDKRHMDIENLKRSGREYLTMMQELRTKNNDLDLQLFVLLENAMVFDGSHVEQPLSEQGALGQLPQSYQQLVIPEEEEDQIPQEREGEKEQEPVDVQTKSWLRQQAESLWKVVKGMGTFCLAVMRCQGLRRCMRRVIRSNQVHPASDGMLPV